MGLLGSNRFAPQPGQGVNPQYQDRMDSAMEMLAARRGAGMQGGQAMNPHRQARWDERQLRKADRDAWKDARDEQRGHPRLPPQVGGGLPGSPIPPGLQGPPPTAYGASVQRQEFDPSVMMMGAAQRSFPHVAPFAGFNTAPYAQAPQAAGYGAPRSGGPIGGQMSYAPPPVPPLAPPPSAQPPLPGVSPLPVPGTAPTMTQDQLRQAIMRSFGLSRSGM